MTHSKAELSLEEFLIASLVPFLLVMKMFFSSKKFV